MAREQVWSAPWRWFIRLWQRLFSSSTSVAMEQYRQLYRDPPDDSFADLNADDRAKVLIRYHDIMGRLIQRMQVTNRSSLLHGEQWRDVVAMHELEAFDRACEQVRWEKAISTDPLTGLLDGKKIFRDAYERAQQQSAGKPDRWLVMVAFDVDSFKRVNELIGHAQADNVLVALGQQLQQLRLGDVAARMGGDEFMFFIDDIALEDIESVLRRLHQALSTIPLPDGLETFSISFGAAAYPLARLPHFTALQEEADGAAYAMKHRGRDGYALLITQPEDKQVIIAQRQDDTYVDLVRGDQLPEPTAEDRQAEVFEALKRILDEIAERHPQRSPEAHASADTIGTILHEARGTSL